MQYICNAGMLAMGRVSCRLLIFKAVCKQLFTYTPAQGMNATCSKTRRQRCLVE